MNARFSKIKGDEKARMSKDEVVLLTISIVGKGLKSEVVSAAFLLSQDQTLAMK